MTPIRLPLWNIVLSVFFIILVALGLGWLSSNHLFFYPVPLQDLVLMTLAIWRLVRLFTYDAITKFSRDWFVGAEPYSFRGVLHTLLNCPWCTGLWFSFVVVFFYFATPFAWPVILILALAALGSFLQVLANFVGWAAELKKKEMSRG